MYIYIFYVFKIEGRAERPELKNDQNIKWRNGHRAAPSVPHSKQQHRPDDPQKHKGEEPALMLSNPRCWCTSSAKYSFIPDSLQDAVRNSVCHTATVIANSFMHTGTTSDQFLRYGSYIHTLTDGNVAS